MTAKLSVTMITLNEEANIRRTLVSVQWADEIIVLDSGSTDRTVEICREFTDKVYHQDWLGFGRQKNAAIDKATGDWILSLDADEPVEPELAAEIREIIGSPGANDGYQVPRKTFFLGKWIRHGGWYPDYNLRLFRKGKGRFEEPKVHASHPGRRSRRPYPQCDPALCISGSCVVRVYHQQIFQPGRRCDD